MAWHNVQITVEVMVEAETAKDAEAKAATMIGIVLFEGMRFWYQITKVLTVHSK